MLEKVELIVQIIYSFIRISKHGNYHRFAVSHSGFVSADSRCCYIAAENFVNPRLAFFDYTAYEFMHQVRVRTMMSSARSLFQGILRVQRVIIPADRKSFEFFG
jgi:hypothetical protein